MPVHTILLSIFILKDPTVLSLAIFSDQFLRKQTSVLPKQCLVNTELVVIGCCSWKSVCGVQYDSVMSGLVASVQPLWKKYIKQHCSEWVNTFYFKSCF